MPYAMPPQTGNTNTTMNYSHVQRWQGGEAYRARQAAANMLPGSTILDVSSDSNGRPHTAHLRDANGQMKTVTFDGNQNVEQTTDGYC